MACKLYYRYGPVRYQLGAFRNRKKAEEFWTAIRPALEAKLGTELQPLYEESRMEKENATITNGHNRSTT